MLSDNSELTDREKAVLALLARGMGTGQISRELGVRPNTVRTHVHKILMKLGVASRREAVLTAMGEDVAPTVVVAPLVDARRRPGCAEDATSRGIDDDGDDSRLRRIRVLIGASERLFREAIRIGLAKEPDVRVVAEATHGGQAVDESGRTRPDVVVLDFDPRTCDLPRAARLIQQNNPGCHTLVLVERDDLSVLMEGLRAGGSGCYAKDGPFIGLVQTLRAVAGGQLAVPRSMLRELLQQVEALNQVRAAGLATVARLTSREREVLALMASGADRDWVATALTISPETARTHIQNVLRKLDLHTQLEAISFVHRHHILDELDAHRGGPGEITGSGIARIRRDP